MIEWSIFILYLLSGSGILAGATALWRQRNIELLKGEINRNNEIMKSSLSILSEGYNQAQEKRLDAIEEMWNYILIIRGRSSKIVTFYTLFLPEEYNTKNSYISSMEMHLFSNQEIINLISNMDKLEKKRPYLGEKLWSLFMVYRAFLSRLMLNFYEYADEGNIKEWYHDGALMRIFDAGLDEKEYEKFKKNNLKKIGSLSEARDILEQKILNEFNRIVTGTYASEITNQRARKIYIMQEELKK